MTSFNLQYNYTPLKKEKKLRYLINDKQIFRFPGSSTMPKSCWKGSIDAATLIHKAKQQVLITVNLFFPSMPALHISFYHTT
uniref:Uncharacterized protein n=1 Tax=Anguilla anguilla TaxID=7936 RepID=A0A0E9WT04_ANGAN